MEQLFVVQPFVTTPALSPPVLAEEPPPSQKMLLLWHCGSSWDRTCSRLCRAFQGAGARRGAQESRVPGMSTCCSFGRLSPYLPRFHRYSPGLTKRCQNYNVPDVVLHVPCLGLSQSHRSLHILYLGFSPFPALWSSAQLLSHRQVPFVGIPWNLKDFSALHLTKLT